MSYRSILLATTLCLAIASIGQASAAPSPASPLTSHPIGPHTATKTPLPAPAGLKIPGATGPTAVNKVPPQLGPQTTQPPAPTKGPTPPTTTPKKGGNFGVILGGEVSVVSVTDDTECYWIKRRFLTPDGKVIRKVKVCEIDATDQQ